MSSQLEFILVSSAENPKTDIDMGIMLHGIKGLSFRCIRAEGREGMWRVYIVKGTREQLRSALKGMQGVSEEPEQDEITFAVEPENSAPEEDGFDVDLKF